MSNNDTKGNKRMVLVTGGCGFIGSHLVDALISEGYEVRVLDSLLESVHGGVKPEWLNKSAEYIFGDVTDRKVLKEALGGVSYVFHLAAYMDYHLDFSTYIQTNAASTALLYELIIENKLPIKKVILASSQSVYGNGKYFCTEHGEQYASLRDESSLKNGDWAVYCSCGKPFNHPIPQTEEDTLHPEIPYAISKRTLEDLALSLGKEHEIPTTIVRYSIVHGARQSFRHFYSGALRSFAVQMLAGEQVLMHEDGGQTRDFIHVDDVTSAHILLLNEKASDYEIYNIGSGRKDRVLDLYSAVAGVLDVSEPPLLPGVYRVGTARDSQMDISKLRQLGWEPKKTLYDNAQDYIEWIKAYPEAAGYLKESYAQMENDGIVR